MIVWCGRVLDGPGLEGGMAGDLVKLALLLWLVMTRPHAGVHRKLRRLLQGKKSCEWMISH